MSDKLYFDLETIPDQREGAFERYLDQVIPPANYKKPESIDKWMAENAETAAAEKYAKTGLSGLYGEICSIGFAVGDGDVKTFTRGINADSEKHLLLQFFIALRKAWNADDNWPRFEWIGHNVIEFDLRFLKQRCFVNRVQPLVMVPADARHGNGSVFDTMKEWAGFRGYVKQDELCEVFGLEQKPGMTGADVWPAYQAEEYERIAAYNAYDVQTVRDIHKVMTYD